MVLPKKYIVGTFRGTTTYFFGRTINIIIITNNVEIIIIKMELLTSNYNNDFTHAITVTNTKHFSFNVFKSQIKRMQLIEK